MAEPTVQIILSPEASPDLAAQLAEAFPDAGLTVAAPPAEADGPGLLEQAAEAMGDVAADAPRLPALVGEWASAHGFGVTTVLLIALALALAYAVERGLRHLAMGAERPERPGDFRSRVRCAAPWLLKRLAFLALFAVAATVTGRAILPAEPEIRRLASAMLDAALYVRLLLVLFNALTAPAAPQRRLMGLDDAQAGRVWAAAIIGATLTALTRAAAGALGVIVGPVEAAGGAKLAIVATGLAIAIWFFWRVSEPVGAMLTRDGRNGLRRLVARNWWLFYVALAALDAGLRAAGAIGLLGREAINGVGPTLLIMLMAPLAIVGVDIWRAEANAASRSAWRTVALAMLEAAVAVTAGLLLLRGWGIDPFTPAETGVAAFVPRLVEAAIVMVVALALWRAASAILRPAVETEDGALVDEENPAGGSRIDTVLPVLRAFALAVIAVVGVMTALTTLGVNIAPLLASAGVLGLAIGFGAQRLVADVISGVFYLVEDAFRSGEYIVTESGKGVVEKISLRSVRLRHHRGPVFTIPFSDIGTVQNHSRDWVKMKFTFQVPAGTDLEMVRKLVKKVGEKLLEVPELEGKFLEPLKSQGALAITGPSYTIGCKFTCKPGQQFTIRRFAYAALQDALLEKGVKLYAPQIMLADDGAPQPMAAAPA